MKKITVLLTVILLTGIIASNVSLNMAQASSISGIITSDTTWTKANSPYNITGNMAIDKEVTLTIEPGVIVNPE